jgi:hypothetical protein
MLLELGDHRLVQGVQLSGIHHDDQSTFDSEVHFGEKPGGAAIRGLVSAGFSRGR